MAAAFPQLEVLELIGQGGMGCVFKARQPQLNRFVALKILPEALAREPAFAARFTREAQTLAALSHPNIVTIHDFGQAGGFFYLLMEFVDGVNLREALRGGRFAPEQALAMVPPLCDALQFAHDRGVIHRDIKPENLLLDRDGRVKIADFGVAKLLAAETGPPRPSSDTLAPIEGESRGDEASHNEGQLSPGLTGDSAAGTPGYMAPEQQTSPHRVDRRADIYSLGVVLYEMLTGELPGQPLDPPSRRIHVDVRLDEIVLRALEREPERRYQQASDLGTDVTTVGDGSKPPAAPAVVTPPAADPRRRRLLWYGLTASLVGLPLALLLRLPVVWVLAVAGIVIGAIKLGLPGVGRDFCEVLWRTWPERRRRFIWRLLFTVALGLSINFAAPHFSVLGDGSARVWTLGLSTPWFALIQRTPETEGVLREARIHLDRFSLYCGPLALTAWCVLGLFQRAEAGQALLLLVKPAPSPGGRPGICWKNVVLAWAAASAIGAIGMAIVVAAMHVVLGGGPPPMPALLWACVPATLVVLRGVSQPCARQSTAAKRKRIVSIVAGIVLVVVFIPPAAIFLYRTARNLPPPPQPVTVPAAEATAGFGFAREIVLRRDGALHDAFLDLEAGRVLDAPAELVRVLRTAGQLSERGSVPIPAIIDWMRTNHVDLVCREGASGLTLVDGMGVLVAAPAAAGSAFESRSAEEVARLSAALAEVLAVHTNREPGNVAMFWFEPHASEHTWGIRTRNGRAGLIELRPEDVRSDSIRFRYKLVGR